MDRRSAHASGSGRNDREIPNQRLRAATGLQFSDVLAAAPGVGGAAVTNPRYAGVIHKCRRCGGNHKTRAHDKKTAKK